MDPYMRKTEALLRQGRARLDRLSVTMRASAPAFSELVRRRRLMSFEARYAEVSRRFELLRGAGPEGCTKRRRACASISVSGTITGRSSPAGSAASRRRQLEREAPAHQAQHQVLHLDLGA
jgi:hypothetical protein